MIRRSHLLRLATVLAALTVPLTLTSPAFADSNSMSSHGKFCVYQHANFGGNSQCFYPGKYNIKSALDNRVSSLRNNTATTLCAYQLDNQRGYKLPVGSHHYFRNLSYDTAPDGRSWNDRISSIGYC